MNLYPLRLKPYMKPVIWGGNNLRRKFKKETGTEAIGETWELSSRDGCESVIVNGEYEGMTFRSYLAESGTDPDEFPLLAKFIDAAAPLSVQVHPCKTEMWYIIDAARGSKLVYGLSDEASPETFAAALSSGDRRSIENCLHYVTVHPGEVYFIPSGLVHALGEGIIVAEIQQNNDTTYRLWDYGRTDENGNGRELHTEQGLEVLRKTPESKIYAQRFVRGRITERTLVNCEQFCVERHTVRTNLTQENKNCTHILCIDGNGEISGVPFRAGESIFIPRGIESYSIKADRPVTVLITKPY